MGTMSRVVGFLLMLGLFVGTLKLVFAGYIPILIGAMFLLLFGGCGFFYVAVSGREDA